jgi:hypothetical protein
MLPAWATVTLAISGTVIGALAGIVGSYFGLRGTRLSLMYQQAEAWRKTLVEAVSACSEPWQELGHLLAEAVGVGAAPLTTSDKDRVRSLNIRIAHALTQATVLFGEDSPAGRAADEFQNGVSRISGTAIIKPIPWDTATTKALTDLLHKTDPAFDAFIREAHLAIRPARGRKVLGFRSMSSW